MSSEAHGIHTMLSHGCDAADTAVISYSRAAPWGLHLHSVVVPLTFDGPAKAHRVSVTLEFRLSMRLKLTPTSEREDIDSR